VFLFPTLNPPVPNTHSTVIWRMEIGQLRLTIR
jgi:hypothetical protein